MPNALIFDFDGLILDTETCEFEVWREVYADHGVTIDLPYWGQFIGRGRHEFDIYACLGEACGRAIDKAALQPAIRQRILQRLEREGPRPGVLDLLQAARAAGYRLAVASASDHGWVDSHLERLGLLDQFDAIKCAEDVPRTKPAPDVYLAALEAVGALAAGSIAFEDSPVGAQAAIAAGLFCVAVPNPITAQLDLDHASLRVACLSQVCLPELLQQI